MTSLSRRSLLLSGSAVMVGSLPTARILGQPLEPLAMVSARAQIIGVSPLDRTRAAMLACAHGLMTTAEVRALEDLPPLDDR